MIAGFSHPSIESVVFGYLPDFPVIAAIIHIGIFERDLLTASHQGKFKLMARKTFRFGAVQERHCFESNIIRIGLSSRKTAAFVTSGWRESGG